MHSAWFLLRGAWSAVVIAYLVLYIVAAGRLRGEAKKHGGKAFWVIASLAAIRFSIRYALGGGLMYRLAVVFVGVAAGVAALDLARMLATQKPDDAAVDAGGSKERIQSLKLN
jgi:asparagine N-glycosylation enzyme membrane subunit Stt3